jgi:hypothetical protein
MDIRFLRFMNACGRRITGLMKKKYVTPIKDGVAFYWTVDPYSTSTVLYCWLLNEDEDVILYICCMSTGTTSCNDGNVQTLQTFNSSAQS